jgi:hypothetical protein
LNEVRGDHILLDFPTVPRTLSLDQLQDHEDALLKTDYESGISARLAKAMEIGFPKERRRKRR